MDDWYYVRNLGRRIYEVQVLDEDGVADLSAQFHLAEADLVLDGRPVPLAVRRAAPRQQEGHGDYVDAQGRSIDPITLELMPAPAQAQAA